MKAWFALVGAALIGATPMVHAQAPKVEGARFDCSQAKDPKACEERRERLKSARSNAEQACQGKTGTERRDCMLKQMCAQSKDPSACDQRVEKRKGEAKSARAACDGKRGAEHDECTVKP